MTFKLGLTGSIGMGKSTTAKMFVEEGCALWDADVAVHRLYQADGAAVAPLSAVFPHVIENGAVSREKLKNLITQDPTALSKIEAIVHPLVAHDRQSFLQKTMSDITVLDIPLLFETGAQTQLDSIVCVSISEQEQEKRVLQRGTMTKDQLLQIVSNQLPNAEKCARSDFVVKTDTLEHARSQVQNIVKIIRKRLTHA